jgi:hypothetical protein
MKCIVHLCLCRVRPDSEALEGQVTLADRSLLHGRYHLRLTGLSNIAWELCVDQENSQIKRLTVASP